MPYTKAVLPNVANFGYAVFLSISATSIWGGVYPYFSEEYRTTSLTVTFYVVQIFAMFLAFALFVRLSWKHPDEAKLFHPWAYSVPLGTGPLLLIASMYAETLTPFFVSTAAFFTGFGMAGFIADWQKTFASMDSASGTASLLSGTAGSAVLFFGICMIPQALVAYLIPLVMTPLAGLCLWLTSKGAESEQPMFEDIPSEHPLVYKNAIKDSLMPALSVGALGFCSGSTRFILVTHQELQSLVNIVSMGALFVLFAAFYYTWRKRTISLDLMALFRTLFPVTGTCLVALPFIGPSFSHVCFAISYACFMLATVLMMVHCVQISRDSGINPLFIFSFYGAVTYAFQTLGYLIGALSGIELSFDVEQLSFISLAGLFVMLMVSLFGRRGVQLHTDRLEFLTLTPPSQREDASAEIAIAKAARQKQISVEGPQRAQFKQRSASQQQPEISDRISKRCQKMGVHFGLSSRETEVAELLARGFTGPAIAEHLFISENTVRTHSRRIYSKLGIHKKQELLAMLESFD